MFIRASQAAEERKILIEIFCCWIFGGINLAAGWGEIGWDDD